MRNLIKKLNSPINSFMAPIVVPLVFVIILGLGMVFTSTFLLAVILVFGLFVINVRMYSNDSVCLSPSRLFTEIPQIDSLVHIVEAARIARKDVRLLEEMLPSINDLFLRGGLRLVIDRLDREFIQNLMDSEIELTRQNELGWVRQIRVSGHLALLTGVWWSIYQSIDADFLLLVEAGPLLTGGLFAGILYLVAEQAKVFHENRHIHRQMIREGVLSIEKKERSHFIEVSLVNYMTRPDIEIYEKRQAEIALSRKSAKKESSQNAENQFKSLPAFEDLIKITTEQMPLVLKETNQEDFVLALKGASPELKAHMYSSISSKAAEIIEEDLESMTDVEQDDIFKAQEKIIHIAQKLSGQ